MSRQQTQEDTGEWDLVEGIKRGDDKESLESISGINILNLLRLHVKIVCA